MSSRCCAVFGHFLYCFASFDWCDFKLRATSDRIGPGCVAEFCAMLEMYDQPRDAIDAIAMQHHVDYSV